ncbi:MAG: hypothetical protein EOO05_08130 [Chitinophagaceae bacterium]|nr:MAG: hypothetical protein EOO05_08130 [Chitinophagaceae bacterium]
MQKIPSQFSGQVLDAAAVQIPVIANSNDRLCLFSQLENTNKLVAVCVHDFSPGNARPFVMVDCATNEIIINSSGSTFPVRRSLDEVLEMVKSGLGTWLTGSTVLLNKIQVLPEALQEIIISKLETELECRLIINLERSRVKSSMDPGVPGCLPKDLYLVPTLRNNQDNIRFYANYFLAKCNYEWARNVTGIEPAAMKKLTEYIWPSGLPDLREVIFQSVLIAADGNELSEKVLPPHIREFSNNANSLRRAILTAERRLIREALEQTKNNKKRAAAILKISRKTLYSKLRIFEEFAA